MDRRRSHQADIHTSADFQKWEAMRCKQLNSQALEQVGNLVASCYAPMHELLLHTCERTMEES